MIKTQKMRRAGNVTGLDGEKRVHRVFGSGNLRGKRNLERPESRWADNDVQEKGRQGVGADLGNLAMDRDKMAGFREHVNGPSGSKKATGISQRTKKRSAYQ